MAGIHLAATLALVSITSLGAALAEPPEQVMPVTGLEFGWEWALEPFELGGPMEDSFEEAFSGDIGYITLIPDGGFSVAIGKHGFPLAHLYLAPATDRGHRPSYMAYWVNARGEARPMRGMMSMGSPDGSGIVVFKPDPAEAEPRSVRRIGLAKLTPEGIRKIADRARAELTGSGATLLPFPEVGKPFEFDLPGMDGGQIRSRDLSGRVVLLDFWATWCGPCMQKMPELKALHERYAEKGLVIVGITLDDDLDAARAEIARSGMAWPHSSVQQVAGGDPKTWRRSIGLDFIPRLLLIGRDGVLREDDPAALEDALESALAQ